jgi:poly(3-hydroxybutyrate) depolymerase
MLTRGLAIGVLLVTLGLASLASAQQAATPAYETVWIPMTEKPALGAPREIHLEAMLYRPSSPGRLPLVVFNHGSTGAGRVAPTSTDFFRYPEVARFFFPPIGHDGHILLPGAISVWRSALQDFLARLGLDPLGR